MNENCEFAIKASSIYKFHEVVVCIAMMKMIALLNFLLLLCLYFDGVINIQPDVLDPLNGSKK